MGPLHENIHGPKWLRFCKLGFVQCGGCVCGFNNKSAISDRLGGEDCSCIAADTLPLISSILYVSEQTALKGILWRFPCDFMFAGLVTFVDTSRSREH